MVARALARAARVVSGEAALNASRRSGANKLRVHWRLADDELIVTVADNGDGLTAGDSQAQEEPAHLARRVAGLGGTVQVDTAPGWGTTVSCRLPLRALSLVPETPAADQIAQLRPREREVLELMVAGLRNREIAKLTSAPAIHAQQPEPIKRTVLETGNFPGTNMNTLLVLVEVIPNAVVPRLR